MKTASTKSGAVYLIDEENRRAMRSGHGMPTMRYDGDWFHYAYVVPVDDSGSPANTDDWLGHRLYFKIRNHPTWEWRSTTEVVAVEDTP